MAGYVVVFCNFAGFGGLKVLVVANIDMVIINKTEPCRKISSLWLPIMHRTFATAASDNASIRNLNLVRQ